MESVVFYIGLGLRAPLSLMKWVMLTGERRDHQKNEESKEMKCVVILSGLSSTRHHANGNSPSLALFVTHTHGCVLSLSHARTYTHFPHA